MRPVISTTEAAERLGIDASYVRRLLDQGVLKGEHFGSGAKRNWMVYESSLAKFKRQRAPRGAKKGVKKKIAP